MFDNNNDDDGVEKLPRPTWDNRLGINHAAQIEIEKANYFSNAGENIMWWRSLRSLYSMIKLYLPKPDQEEVSAKFILVDELIGNSLKGDSFGVLCGRRAGALLWLLHELIMSHAVLIYSPRADAEEDDEFDFEKIMGV